AEAGATEASAAGKLAKILNRQEAQAVRADYLCYLIDCVMAGYEVVPRVYIRAVVAWVQQRRAGDAHMHLRCAGVPKKLYYLRAGRAPDYGVINHDYSLALYGFGYRIELYFHLVGSVALSGRDKCSSDVLVLYESYSIWYTG